MWNTASALLLAFAGLAAGEQPAGAVVEAVTCSTDPSQSYALFVPSRYTPDREWPILYCFDPMARGRVPVDRFREAAETYGYLVAGSNSSHNGPLAPSVAAAQAMWNDTHARFRIDARRTYGAGFSGGARLVSDMALSSDQLAGVVACGAGFPGSQTPKSVPFLFFGTAGIEDFNYFEMKAVDRALDGIATHRVVFYQGGHDWAPPALATEAIEWFELQAMKRGITTRDESLVARLLRKRLEKARALEAAADLAGAYAEYSALAVDFKGFEPVDESEAAANRLAKTREVRRAASEEREEAAEHERATAELFRAVEQGDAAAAAARLRKQEEMPDGSRERRIARRVVSGAYVRAYYEAQTQLDARQYAQAARWLELESALRPERPLLYCELARVYALAGDRTRSRQALARSMKTGLGYYLLLAIVRR
jgi:hypothetical protein